MHNSIILLTEDILSEAVAERIVNQVSPDTLIGNRLGRKGKGFIQSKLRRLNESAAGLKILVIVDRDSPSNCPIELSRQWIGGPRKPNLVVRFSEMEIESWLLADAEGMARLLSVPKTKIPSRPDELSNPKREIVNLARSSNSSRVREFICPTIGSVNQVGPGYNEQLEHFIRREWRLEAASAASPSLGRAERRVRELLDDE